MLVYDDLLDENIPLWETLRTAPKVCLGRIKFNGSSMSVGINSGDCIVLSGVTQGSTLSDWRNSGDCYVLFGITYGSTLSVSLASRNIETVEVSLEMSCSDLCGIYTRCHL